MHSNLGTLNAAARDPNTMGQTSRRARLVAWMIRNKACLIVLEDFLEAPFLLTSSVEEATYHASLALRYPLKTLTMEPWIASKMITRLRLSAIATEIEKDIEKATCAV